jgi:hypothetical protein
MKELKSFMFGNVCIYAYTKEQAQSLFEFIKTKVKSNNYA